MKLGSHRDSLAASASLADQVIWYEPKGLTWGLVDAIGDAKNQLVLDSIDGIITHIQTHAQAGDAIIIMSNGGFEGIHAKIVDALA